MIVRDHELTGDEARKNAEQRAHPHLERRMPNKFFQLIFHGHFSPHFPEQCHHLIQDPCLNARLSPDAHRIVHNDDRYDDCYRKFKTPAAILDSRRRCQRTHGSGMGAGHTTASHHPFPYEFLMDHKMNDRFQYLCHEPAHDRRNKNRILNKTA